MTRRDRASALVGSLLDERERYTLHELCSLCGMHAELAIEMIEEGVLCPRGRRPHEWRFDSIAIVRAQRALRFRRDLRVNWAGAALALDLLAEVESLQREIARARPLPDDGGSDQR